MRSLTRPSTGTELQLSLLVGLSYNFLYWFKPRLRSAPPGALPGSGCARAPAFGPLGAAAADARPHVDRAGSHEPITA
ncbi:hypothetical protein TUSST3_28830 [Streptomyces sp. TUS-ST3]|nr:hypothetical protein TUSST3_28830 [Streptomyces sp. TUS-ST3]